MPAGEAVTVFEDRRDAERGRRFDDEARVVEEHPHTRDDRRLLDQDGVVSDQQKVVQDGRDGTPARDAVGDGVGRVGGDNTPLPPRVCHRRCAQRLDTDHLDFGSAVLQHMPHTGGQRPAAEGDQDGVERRHGVHVHQFQADGCRALAGFDVEAVFEQPDAVVVGDRRRPLAGQLVVAVHEFELGTQCTDAVELGRGGEAGCHDGDVEPPGATGPGEGLAEVARAGAHHGLRAIVGEQADDQLGAAALETADRIRRFEFDAHRAPEAGLQRLTAVQRGVEKDRVDRPASRPDPSGVEARPVHDTAA
nr:hypothetical protein [Streptomyces odonnellii]